MVNQPWGLDCVHSAESSSLGLGIVGTRHGSYDVGRFSFSTDRDRLELILQLSDSRWLASSRDRDWSMMFSCSPSMAREWFGSLQHKADPKFHPIYILLAAKVTCVLKSRRLIGADECARAHARANFENKLSRDWHGCVWSVCVSLLWREESRAPYLINIK